MTLSSFAFSNNELAPVTYFATELYNEQGKVRDDAPLAKGG
jgi:hypothetical protein